jgi:divalent metal cation (Fe/Co/Zn/Cd) transporter
VQVLLLVVAVFAFFLLFGSLVMTADVQQSWTGEKHLGTAPLLDTVSASLVKVSLFLAAFSGLYFTVSAVTDDTYRRQFFAAVEEQLERAVGMRAVHHALVSDAGRPAPPAPAG